MVDPINDDDAERELVAVRAFAFLIRHGKTVAAAVLIASVLGFVAGHVAEPAYESHAAIEVGMRIPMEPLEMPIVARERLAGLIEANRKKYPSVVAVELENRYEPKSRKLTRVIDVNVAASTSSAAKAILDLSIAELLAAHKEMHAYETELIERERAQYETAQKKIETAIEALGGGAEEPAMIAPGDKKPQLLSGALLDIQRLSNATTAMLSARRLPETVIAEPPTVPEEVASRAWMLAIAGAMLGALLGLSIGMFRELSQPLSADEARVRSVRAVEEHDAHRAP